MKHRIIPTILVILLFLTGCAQKDSAADLQDTQSQQTAQNQQNTPEQENHPGKQPENQQQTTDWDYDIGTNADNLFAGGDFAMGNDFVYINTGRYIVEYDMLSGTSVEIPMPEGGGDLYERLLNGNSSGNLFLLEDGPMFLLSQNKNVFQRDEFGKVTDHTTVRLNQLALLHLDGTDPTVYPEFGEDIWEIIPVRKETVVQDPDNPFAGFDFYYRCTYNTFPDLVAQMEEIGLTMPEPESEEEWARYYTYALFHMDGDTMERTLLAKEVQGFRVTDTHIYYASNNLDGVVAGKADSLFVSDRHSIDFQPLDSGLPTFAFQQGPDGLYFSDPDTGELCRYQDGAITGTGFFVKTGNYWNYYRIWGSKVIYEVQEWSYFGSEEQPWSSIRLYDLETGEDRLLCDHVQTSRPFVILQDRYVACQEYYWEYDAYILLDPETGERIEMYRVDRTAEEAAKEQEEFEKSYKKLEEMWNERQQSTGEPTTP